MRCSNRLIKLGAVFDDSGEVRDNGLVQCKQWKSWKVGVKTIRELYGVVTAERAERGIVVCCGDYTKEARSFAENKPLELLDGSTLWSMIQDVRKDNSASKAHGARKTI